jgi:hypothetical protein
MRASFLVAVPVLVALSTLPAEGQASARLRLDIPIGRQPRIAYAAPRRSLVVREYDPYRYGAWENYYDEWIPETVYFYDGNYYDYPIVEYAQPIVVYRYRNEVFLAPRQREFIQWRDGRNYRDLGRAYQPLPRDYRNDRGYQAPRRYDGGQYRQPPQYDRNVRPVPQDNRIGRNVRPAPQDGRNGRSVRPALQVSRNNSPARGGDRSRPRPH